MAMNEHEPANNPHPHTWKLFKEMFLTFRNVLCTECEKLLEQ